MKFNAKRFFSLAIYSWKKKCLNITIYSINAINAGGLLFRIATIQSTVEHTVANNMSSTYKIH